VPTNQIEIGRHVAAARRPQPQRTRGGAFLRCGVDQVCRSEFLQHEVASRAGAVGVFAGVVKGGTLDQPDQQCQFTGVELVQGFREVILAAKSEAVNRA
jgi:hypothetical protein